MVKAHSHNAPKLRFPEFDEEWKDRTLASVFAHLDAGVSVNSSDRPCEQGEMAVLKTSCVSSGVFNPTENKLVDDPIEVARLKEPVLNGTIIISRMNTPQLVGANAYVQGDYPNLFLPDRLWAAKPFPSIHSRWAGYLMAHERIRVALSARASGTSGSMKNLSKDAVYSLPIKVPSYLEQKKIAAFLESVDEKLKGLQHQHDLLTDYKRGVSQQLFSQKLRFARDDGSAFPEWEERKLLEIAERRTIKNHDLAVTRVLTNSAVKGVVDQSDYFEKDIANAENLGGYYLVEQGDFVYNPRVSVTAPVGPIKRNNTGTGVMSPLYTIFRMNIECITFFEQYFESHFWHQYLKSIANYGARHDRMAITTGGFMDMPLPWPDPDEQRKIADFLSTVDAKITMVAEQITQTKAFKKGLLQQMFV